MNTYEFIVSMVGFLVISVLGTMLVVRNAKTGRERTFVLKAAGWQAVLGFGILTACYFFQWNQPRLVFAVALAIWIPLMLWIERRVQRIRTQQDDTDA